MELPAQQVVTGRRLYVHEYSFKALASTGHVEEGAVKALLTKSWIFRVALHHIGSDCLVGALAKHEEQLLAKILHDRYRLECTPLLGGMRLRTPRGEVPLLEKGETLHATCFDSGYYTFATDSASAIRMYDDTVPLRSLYSACSRGTGDSDLTMVRGSRLVWVGGASALEQTEGRAEQHVPAEALEQLELAVEAGRRTAARRLDGFFD